jgi:sortase A
VFRGDWLLRAGVIAMAVALVLVIAAVVAGVLLRGESGRVGAAEVGRKLLGELPGHSSGKEAVASKESPSEDEESLGNGSSSGASDGLRGGGTEGGKEPQKVGGASEAGGANARSAASRSTDEQSTSGGQSSPGEDRTLPAAEDDDWPAPTRGEIRRANAPRHYELLPGAVMGLTIEAIGIHDAPVFDSDGPDALANGVAHVPGTSWPWSSTPQRNVYLAGHRMGFRGTWSRMLFYNLNKLGEGDKVVLRDRSGRTYEYRVSEILLADPTDAWVMGQVRGRDMVSLQTCTPIPTFEKRLIVRADRL